MILHLDNLTAEFNLTDEADTQRLGESLAKAIAPGLVIFLDGELGAGKTTLVRSLVQTLGYNGAVRSPTYSLVEIYVVSSLYLYHFDFYRFESPEEFLDAGFDDYFNETTVCLVEWPERALGCLPSPDLRLRFHYAGLGRFLEAMAYSPAGAQCLTHLTRLRAAETS